MAYITLNKTHFFNNLDIITQLTCAKDKIALVLKDNAYGHGLLEIAQLACEYGIRKVVVRSDEEARLIEHLFEYILVLASKPKNAHEKIRYTINDMEAIADFPKGTRVELKVDSGMNRNGIEFEELESAFEAIHKKELLLEALFTHHGSADEDNGLYILQKRNFEKIQADAQTLALKYNFSPLHFHSANSATLFREGKLEGSMARVGIAVYGCLELEGIERVEQLRPILSLYAKRLSSRLLQVGECVGYGATYKAERQCIVSNYDVGYGDGFLRAVSNIYITPQNIQIAGRISMDNSSFLSDKEEILIFDDARKVAKFANTISYEMLTALKANIRRLLVQ